MYSPAVLALALTLAAPAFSAPVRNPTHKSLVFVARDDANTTATTAAATPSTSAAPSPIDPSNIIASLVASLPNIVNELGTLFGGDSSSSTQQQTRALGAGPHSDILRVVPLAHNPFNSPQHKRELELGDLIARQLVAVSND
ncbi:hypothetical protein EIP91_010400, partial [Steccherinum ochraceum]